jgi:hypothetical protein
MVVDNYYERVCGNSYAQQTFGLWQVGAGETPKAVTKLTGKLTGFAHKISQAKEGWGKIIL